MRPEQLVNSRASTPAAARIFDPASGGVEANRLRLHALVRLRWLAVAGQLAAVLGVYLGLGFPLPFGPCLAAIATSAWLNIFLMLRRRKNAVPSEGQAALLLAYDILQLAGLLYLTGGLQNPFAFLFLIPVTVSAATLSPGLTTILAALAFAAATFLAFDHLPLPWQPGKTLVLPPVYIAGMWVAVTCGTVFSAIYAWRIAEGARRMAAAAVATELVLAREQQLSALDGLAAAAAHELGTPLATISLVAKELKREWPEAQRFGEDLDLLTSQAERCRSILARLADRAAQKDAMFERQQLHVMIEELADPLRGTQVAIAVDARAAPGAVAEAAREPVVRRNPAVRYGLANLIGNAADFASLRVTVDARWDGEWIRITISDDGPGFAQEIINRLGEPYVTTRRTEAPAKRNGHQGMGLGFFIAKTLLERSGARVALANRDPPERGAIVRLRWPRRSMELAAD